MADDRDRGGRARVAAGHCLPDRLSYGEDPAFIVEVVANRHEAQALALGLWDCLADHLRPFFPAERMLGRKGLEGRSDHHDDLRRRVEGQPQQRQMAVVKRLEAADEDRNVMRRRGRAGGHAGAFRAEVQVHTIRPG